MTETNFEGGPLEPGPAETGPEIGNGSEPDERSAKITPATWTVIGLVVACTVGAVLYRLLISHDMGRSAAMFLGIPATLAILLALTPKAKSLIGGIVKGITLFLLIVAPLLGEGYLCILIASPLFYLVGVVIGAIVQANRKGVRSKASLSCVALLILPLCLEGVVPQLSGDREETVAVTRVVNAPAEAVEAALARSPDLETPLPRLLRIGFPRPLAAFGEGLAVGATRTLHFAGAEGDPPGDLVSRVADRGPGFARMETVSDTSKLTQWVRWESSEVAWRAVDARHTSVTWRIHFERELDPGWYFTPLERAVVRQSAEYMIRANASPRGLGPVSGGDTR